MPREYRHIEQYEKEIMKLREEGLSQREIGERLGFRKEKITAEVQLHSDQGFQYTSQAYFKLTQSYNITPSMSRRGNPYDNAMAENFFSILKSECIHRAKPRTYEEARLLIDQYISFYNNVRIQLKTKLTPLQKRSQYVA